MKKLIIEKPVKGNGGHVHTHTFSIKPSEFPEDSEVARIVVDSWRWEKRSSPVHDSAGRVLLQDDKGRYQVSGVGNECPFNTKKELNSFLDGISFALNNKDILDEDVVKFLETSARKIKQ